MNKKQIIVILIALAGCGYQLLFPAWQRLEFADTDQGQVLLTISEHRLFNNPPAHSDLKPPYVAWKYSFQACGLFAAITGVLCFLVRTKRVKEAEVSGEVAAAGAAF